MKSLKKLGTTLSKKEQKEINGGLGGGPFLGSICYTTLSRCEDALASAIGFGADPNRSRCVPCTTSWGAPGFMVRAVV